MFSFFSAIFTKVTSVVASIIIAVGLVSAPIQSPEPPQEVRVITEIEEEPSTEVEQASSTVPNSVTIPAPAPAKTSKITIPPTKSKTSTSVSVSSGSSVGTTSQLNSVIVESSKESAPQPTTTPTTTQPVIEVSFFANEFKFSSHIYPIPIISLQDPQKVIISATGYRNNYAVRGWLKWWTANRNSGLILVEERLNSVFYPIKEEESIVPIEFTGEIPLDKLSPYGSKGYTKHYFQFYFERGSSQSHSEPIEFAEGY